MTHADINHAAPTGPAPQKGRKQRLALMVVLGVCGVLIALVLLSNPRIQAQINGGITMLKDQFATTPEAVPEAVLEAVPAAASPLGQPARVQIAPTPRVRVRRAGVISQD